MVGRRWGGGGVAFVATWRAASRLRAAHRLCGIAEALDGIREEAVGGGIFALRRPRPYSRHCGEGVAMHAASTIIYAKTGINGDGVGG